jgi:hypothetical protein
MSKKRKNPSGDPLAMVLGLGSNATRAGASNAGLASALESVGKDLFSPLSFGMSAYQAGAGVRGMKEDGPNEENLHKAITGVLGLVSGGIGMTGATGAAMSASAAATAAAKSAAAAGVAFTGAGGAGAAFAAAPIGTAGCLAGAGATGYGLGTLAHKAAGVSSGGIFGNAADGTERDYSDFSADVGMGVSDTLGGGTGADILGGLAAGATGIGTYQLGMLQGGWDWLTGDQDK